MTASQEAVFDSQETIMPTIHDPAPGDEDRLLRLLAEAVLDLLDADEQAAQDTSKQAA
jgi:hypothetical protein